MRTSDLICSRIQKLFVQPPLIQHVCMIPGWKPVSPAAAVVVMLQISIYSPEGPPGHVVLSNPGSKLPAQKMFAVIWLVKNESNIYFGIYRSKESIIICASVSSVLG